MTLSILFIMFCCLFIVFIFSLLKAGKRADDFEEKIIGLLSTSKPQSEDNKPKGLLLLANHK